MQENAQVDSTFIRNPTGPLMLTLSISKSETTVDTQNADTGPNANPQIVTTISLKSMLRKPAMFMGISFDTYITTYAMAQNMAVIATFCAFLFVMTVTASLLFFPQKNTMGECFQSMVIPAHRL